jgi:hypothetical protein
MPVGRLESVWSRFLMPEDPDGRSVVLAGISVATPPAR